MDLYKKQIGTIQRPGEKRNVRGAQRQLTFEILADALLVHSVLEGH